ncbi:SGNH/GDSL hydrolase family protein [Bradyrhizobium sp. 83012]|uniref:SGNH/GDSL hydrolase family protein n=1 Tax=Bradyrhizobium aeschynomenes TaxID=2734909 RepID=A0ABX2CHC7_9BRAD|nr:SGNH/GDSL hydrolase family protein [Bradyrhizobium aeschynomenes]NPU12368.1 SGNH/GDSL hydrolase family protein [Bradyrhizobium aeschynomenes]NPU67601.1 SGNH/GDSL hydrolase family protein [Bradyrhizobium aeschynomenes]
MAAKTQARLGFVLFAVIAAAAATFVLVRRSAAPSANDHRTVRQLVVHYNLQARPDDPIIVLGDSIVEAATLPATACGHPVVNAGLAGAGTRSDLAGWLKPALGPKRPFAIIVSLGVNDALTVKPDSSAIFAVRYEALLRELASLTTRLFIVDFPPVETRGPFTAAMEKTAMASITGYRAALPELAKRTGATFLPLPPMETPFTLEGIHLNAAGYRSWDQAILQGTELACR